MKDRKTENLTNAALEGEGEYVCPLVPQNKDIIKTLSICLQI